MSKSPPGHFRSLDELGQGLAQGVWRSADLVRACLDRIERSQLRLHAFASLEPEAALRAAAAADARRARGYSLGPLDGVPVAVKDMFDTAGQPGACGSAAWAGRRGTRTSGVIERLDRAGACIVGKTHMVEFAFGAWGINPRLGTPWNPWDSAVHRVPGGSSSGSAVAVAAGLVPIAIGSDTGGSVRTPAALNGVTGLKASNGAVDLAGALPLSATLDSVGVFARSARDAWQALAVLEEEPTDLPIPEGVRIAVLDEGELVAVDAEVVAAYRAAQDMLAAAGATLDVRKWPFEMSEIVASAGVLMAADGWRLHGDLARDPQMPLGEAVRARLLAGRNIDAQAYARALARHRELVSIWPDWLADASAILTPTLPVIACPVADVDERATTLGLFTRIGNFAGASGLSLPAGFSAGGLPIGIQLLGRGGGERQLAALGQVFQRHSGFHHRIPDLAAFGL